MDEKNDLLFANVLMKVMWIKDTKIAKNNLSKIVPLKKRKTIAIKDFILKNGYVTRKSAIAEIILATYFDNVEYRAFQDKDNHIYILHVDTITDEDIVFNKDVLECSNVDKGIQVFYPNDEVEVFVNEIFDDLIKNLEFQNRSEHIIDMFKSMINAFNN